MTEDNIFDISFTCDGQTHTGWVNPSEKLTANGKPVSYHAVIDNVSFGYLSFQNGKWSVNEERPPAVVELIGQEIDKYYAAQVRQFAPALERKKEEPRFGNIGKNNAGGFE